jgi:hypothetical protein
VEETTGMPLRCPPPTRTPAISGVEIWEVLDRGLLRAVSQHPEWEEEWPETRLGRVVWEAVEGSRTCGAGEDILAVEEVVGPMVNI